MKALAFILALLPLPLAAHEFWIDPHDFAVAKDAPLVADIRVGEDFKGSNYSYRSDNIVRFDIVLGDAVIPVEGRAGDRPALNMAVAGEGLAVVVHQTTDSRLSYTEREKFVNFVEHKDLTGVLEAHAARGLPDTGFREVYSRYAKSLIALGSGEGADQNVGLLTEIVAEANPYTDDLSGGFPVRVLYEGAPRGNVQVELFAKSPDDVVTVSTHRTDADGRVVLPALSGVRYLADSVVMRPVEPEQERDPVWESLWASLTYAIPE